MVEFAGGGHVYASARVDVFSFEVALLCYPIVKFDDYGLSHFFQLPAI